MYILQVSVQNKNKNGSCHLVNSDFNTHTSIPPEPQVLADSQRYHQSKVSVKWIATLEDKMHQVKANENNVR